MFSAVTEDLPRFSLAPHVRRRPAGDSGGDSQPHPGRLWHLPRAAARRGHVSGRARTAIPARVYLSFVLTSTNYLVLLMALLLSAFSLPNDIKNRTIYTVVTKPIRASEIVLGRTLGFAAVGTAMLAGDGARSATSSSTRSLSHDHAIDRGQRAGRDRARTARSSATAAKPRFDQHHRHTFEVDADGKGRTNTVQGHWHEVERLADGKYRVGPPQGHLIARAPHLRPARDLRPRRQAEQGNQRRQRVGVSRLHRRRHAGRADEGRTPSGRSTGVTQGEVSQRPAAGAEPPRVPHVQGRHRAGRAGRNGDSQSRTRTRKVKRSGPIVFESKEFVADRRIIPRELNSEIGGAAGAGKVDLFGDLVDNGKVRGRAAVRRSGAVFRRRRAGRLSAARRCLVRAAISARPI